MLVHRLGRGVSHSLLGAHLALGWAWGREKPGYV